MADNITVDNGLLSDYAVATEEIATGIHAQKVLLVGSPTGTQAAVSVTTSATVVAAALATRNVVNVMPTNGTIYIGYTNAVTTATGIPVTAGQVWEERDFKGALYAIAASTIDVRVLDAL